jgi:hypothetical protein
MNYFEYFSEIEQRFSRRRGSILLLSTLDWALIETWREAGVPLEAVLRGIDDAFDKYEARSQRTKGRLRRVNGLAWCAQAVMQATEEMAEAATGAQRSEPRELAASGFREASGFEVERIAAYLERNAVALEATATLEQISQAVHRLRELALTMRSENPLPLDDLDRTLTVLEERILSALQSVATEDELIALRTQADSELAPYRSRMSAVQLRQVQTQFQHKRLLESRGLPRLSLFYMGHGE